MPPPVANDDPATRRRQHAADGHAATGVLGNDTLNGASITAFDADRADGGTVRVNADGSFTLHAAQRQLHGIDTFTYTLTNVAGSDPAP